MNQIRNIKNVSYGIIGREFDKKHLPKVNGGETR